jgi:hypothetical protein
MQSTSSRVPTPSNPKDRNTRQVGDTQRVRYSLIHLRRKRQQKSSFIGVEDEARRKINRIFIKQRRKYIMLTLLLQFIILILFAIFVDYNTLKPIHNIHDEIIIKDNNDSNKSEANIIREPFLDRIFGLTTAIEEEEISTTEPQTDEEMVTNKQQNVEDDSDSAGRRERQDKSHAHLSPVLNLDRLLSKLQNDNLQIKKMLILNKQETNSHASELT